LADVQVPPLQSGDRTGGHSGQIADFVDCVRTGRIPETICTDNIKSLAMALGAVASAQAQTTVTINC
jgi:predicted dehydrogenase